MQQLLKNYREILVNKLNKLKISREQIAPICVSKQWQTGTEKDNSSKRKKLSLVKHPQCKP